MSKKKEYLEAVNIGFDIGISSVGWSVIHYKTGNILETGVSIFAGADAAKNVGRRNFRQARRLIRRRKTRLRDTAEFLNKHDFPYNEKIIENENPYEVRVKGLSKKLTREELAMAIYHLVKRRGISYALSDVNDTDNSGNDYQNSLAINQKLLTEKTPAEIQLERLNKYKSVRGRIEVEENEIKMNLLNVFPNDAYLGELNLILKKQQEFYPEINDDFIEEVAKILTRKRQYFEGPGTKRERTNYGIYRTDGKTLENIFETLIGRDKIFPEEYRAAGNSYTAQLFNLLNDLNNLKISNAEDGKLSVAQKQQIIEELRTTEKNVTMLKLIAKVCKVKSEDIHGYRTDNKDKADIHSLQIYRKVRKIFLANSIDINEWPTAFFDDLGPIITLNTEAGEVRRNLQDKLALQYTFLNEKIIDLLVENMSSFGVTGNNKWHRFSLKTMKLLIPDLLATNKEQMTLLTENGLRREDKTDYKDRMSIDIQKLCDNLYNPVVRKSVRQTMKIFNELFKKYSNISYIVLEMPRESNADEERKKIKKMQKENAKEKEAAVKEFQSLSGITDVQWKHALYKEKQLLTKVRFWYQQHGKCPYSGKAIEADKLFLSSHLFEIDHIIPQAVSFDDSLNNKVLCYSEMNQQKAKQTPYEFMSRGGGQGFDSLIAYVQSNKRFSSTKVKNLLFKEDLSDIDTKKKFIARNLVDTRYASRVVLNELQSFLSDKKLATKITVVRGKFTSTLRKKWQLNKSRDTHYHHATDAAIIAATPMLGLWQKSAALIPKTITEDDIDLETGEIINDKEYAKEVFHLPYEHFLEQLVKIEHKVKFSHQVDKKMNRKVSDATIYATRITRLGSDKKDESYTLGSINDIYKEKDYQAFKKIYDKDKHKFIAARKDPRTFEKLEKILLEYPDFVEVVKENGKVVKESISPFELYRREHGYITKFSKKDNGPIVRRLKYYDSKVGSHLAITPNGSKNPVILQSLKPWRTDVYLNPQNGEYEIMGIKYADLKFMKKEEYGVPKEKYEKIKENEGIHSESDFLFSLYRNDRVKIIDTQTNENVELLFGSRTLPAQKGCVELKPINKSVFDNNEVVALYGQTTSSGRFIKKFISGKYKLYKVNTDVLGNPYYIDRESISPRNILDEMV